jgi:hypothetical protein
MYRYPLFTTTLQPPHPSQGQKLTRGSVLPGGCPTRSWKAPAPLLVTHPVSLLSGVGSNSQRYTLRSPAQRSAAQLSARGEAAVHRLGLPIPKKKNVAHVFYMPAGGKADGRSAGVEVEGALDVHLQGCSPGEHAMKSGEALLEAAWAALLDRCSKCPPLRPNPPLHPTHPPTHPNPHKESWRPAAADGRVTHPSSGGA